jgi:hypothetical protein
MFASKEDYFDKEYICSHLWQGQDLTKVLEILSPELLANQDEVLLVSVIEQILKILFFRPANQDQKAAAVIKLLRANDSSLAGLKSLCVSLHLIEFKAAAVRCVVLVGVNSVEMPALTNAIADLMLSGDNILIKAAYSYFPLALLGVDPVLTEEHWQSIVNVLK